MLDNYGSGQKLRSLCHSSAVLLGVRFRRNKRDLPIENYCRKDPIVVLGTE